MTRNVAWCYYCVWAVLEDKFPGYIRDIDLQTTMANGGWSKWNQGTSHLENHASSAVHKAGKMACLEHHKKESISQKVYAKNAQELQRIRIVLEAILDTLMFLARKGLALSGYTTDDSNFCQSTADTREKNETVKIGRPPKLRTKC